MPPSLHKEQEQSLRFQLVATLIISISFYNFLFQYIRTNMKRLNAYNYIEGGGAL